MRPWPVRALALLSGRHCCPPLALHLARNASALRPKPISPQSDPPSPPRPDPFTLAAPQLLEIRTALVDLLGSSVKGLDEIAKYYFCQPSKHLRPLLVVLFSQATNGLGKDWQLKLWQSSQNVPGGHADALDQPMTRPDVLLDHNPDKPDKTAPFTSRIYSLDDISTPEEGSLPSRRSYLSECPPPPKFTPSSPTLTDPLFVLPTQIRLAQIVEMIHAASLLHDDVIDNSTLRRGVTSAPAAFGNKSSVLAGNFILGRASSALARLGDHDVTELIASIITNLVEGELLQLKDILSPDAPDVNSRISASQSPKMKRAWMLYLQKTYMKTASLMAKGARGAVALGGCREGEIHREIAYAYGRNLGLAFQVLALFPGTSCHI
jgi:hexaprenyl-diphosphate synthase